MIPVTVRLYWLRQDLICLITGHDPHKTDDGTWCERCLDALDEKAHVWDQLEAQAQAQR